MPPSSFSGHDYRPDPFDLQLDAVVIVHRAALLGHDKTMHDLLMRVSEDYLLEGQYLAALSGAMVPWDRSGARLDFRQLVLDTWDPSIRSAVTPAEPFLEAEEWVGHVQTSFKPFLGRTRHHFRLAAHADAHRGRPRPTPATANAMAVVELVQHANERWQVLHAEVSQAHRRQGLATLLYDRIESFLGIELRPSGWLSEDAYRFWQRRYPDSIQSHRQDERLPRLWLSAEARLDLLAVATGKLLRRADENGRPN